MGSWWKTRAAHAVHGALALAVRQRWLVTIASRALAPFPSIKARLRRTAAAPVRALTVEGLTDAQLRVLLDLRAAAAAQRKARR